MAISEPWNRNLLRGNHWRKRKAGLKGILGWLIAKAGRIQDRSGGLCEKELGDDGVRLSCQLSELRKKVC